MSENVWISNIFRGLKMRSIGMKCVNHPVKKSIQIGI